VGKRLRFPGIIRIIEDLKKRKRKNGAK